ncbi:MULTISPECIES: DNA translocase FtsK [Desulfobacula]|uniref:FtsK: DNA translocase n=1 Tax=Desulfobacula toluolica (strain DSM 7467 / Tol2) TaxID=651182 RepID=K0N9M8_DESTT|nr:MULTISPECIES: DNA translocase FtsK [Desulfobacula]CCK80659.1 FtsK: DNA translocase [Desulfobacula toluolica Tol2]
MEKNSYSLDNNILTIRTEYGDYGFKIEDGLELANAERIADLMVSELEKIEKKFQGIRENSNPYAKLLLANLNISDKYIQLENEHIQLEHKYNRLFNRNEKMKAFYHDRYQSGDAGSQKFKTDKTIHCSSSFDDLKNNDDILSEQIQTNQEDTTSLTETQPDDNDNSSSFKEEDFSEKQPPVITALEKTDRDLTDHDLSEESRKNSFISSPSMDIQTTTEPLEDLQTEPLEEIEIELSEDTETELLEDMQKQSPAVQQIAMQNPETQTDTQNLNSDSNNIAEPAQTQAPSLAKDLVLPVPPTISASPSAQFRINKPEEKQNSCIESCNTDSDEFQLPALDFLKRGNGKIEIDHEAIRRDAELLEQKLGYFGITGEVMEVSPGPVITTFEYRPAPGIKISKIVNLADDLALALSAFSIRIVAPIPGKDVIGIEIPNLKKSLVPFIDIVRSDDFINSTSKLPICLGKDIIGNPVVVELDKMPHLLIAGATGTGKSVGLNAMIASILYKSPPDKVNFIMIDPKRIELSLFNDIPHLLTPVITDMKKANIALQWVVREMERRYEILAKLQVRNIEQYNHKVKQMACPERDKDEAFEEFSYIVIIIDELADLMMTAAKDIELSLTRIAQMARAAGIHLVLATQRPSVDVLTGIIKANFPTRISFQVSSKTDSRTIIDSNGAETLLGSGDMLFVPPGTARLARVHGTYLSEDELVTITEFLKAQKKPNYIFDVITENDTEPAMDIVGEDEYDEKYQAALEFVLVSRQASISGVQRALRVGYNRAARIIDLMEKRGIVGPSDGVKPRQVLINRMD